MNDRKIRKKTSAHKKNDMKMYTIKKHENEEKNGVKYEKKMTTFMYICVCSLELSV